MRNNWRVTVVFIGIFLLGAAIISRLVFIQIKNYGYWKALAQGQQTLFDEVTGERGEIFIRDKEGNLYNLATSKEWLLVCVSPEKILQEDEKVSSETIKKLSATLALDEKIIDETIKNSASLCEPLKKRLSSEEVAQLEKADLKGIYIKKEMVRYYSYETLLSHILGFVGGEGKGQYGIEGYYEESLRGSSGFQEGEKGPKLYLIKNSVKKGMNLNLTIDYNIQFKTEKLLENIKDELKIEGGTIIIGDPSTGKIIALANYPTFNPNEYSKEKDMSVFQNSAIQKTYEPGSVFKPITMAAALENEKITPQTTYKDEGFLKVGNYFIYNYDKRVWGEKTMTEVLEKSINTGAVFAERQAGDEQFLKSVEKFGFFEPTGIDLQGEVFSENKTLRNGKEINFVTASFGQGIEVTPMQLFKAFSIIANGGKLIKPYLAEDFVSSLKTEPEPVISEKTASQLISMLVSVVENGYAKAARIPGYYIAGKTGTAQVAWTALGIDKPGYSEETTQTFIGFAPAFNPRFVILIKLDNPATKTAEYSAVPMFRELAEYIIDYWQIPPDYEP